LSGIKAPTAVEAAASFAISVFIVYFSLSFLGAGLVACV